MQDLLFRVLVSGNISADRNTDMALIDSFHRVIDYLRVSVTDRCNFRCVYCMPEEGAPVAPKSSILTYEEIYRLVRIASDLGMTKIRLTGGEPLVRRDIELLVQLIGSIPVLKDLSITTNGMLLPRYAESFAKYGLKRVNVSLDTLQPDRFLRIARRGNLADVLEGIEAAEKHGLTPIKINCVVMRGYNEDEVVDFARLTESRSWDIRFIELMPINWSSGDDSTAVSLMNNFFPKELKTLQKDSIRLFADTDSLSFKKNFHLSPSDQQTGQLDAVQMRNAFVPTAESRANIEHDFGLLEPAEIITNGPARSYRIPGARGTISFISQLTNDICVNCNRLRLTADGQLRPCLMADGEVDLRTALRSEASDEDIAALFELTGRHKPFEHRLEDGNAPIGRNMSQLGG